jgi:hypothetical protein
MQIREVIITSAQAAGVITATIKGGAAQVKDKTITLTRTETTGAWKCTSDAKQKFIGPVGICEGLAN